MPVADSLRFDFGDGVSALDRTMRAITMMADGAIQLLESMGWRRRSIGMEVLELDPLPCWVTLNGRRVYELTVVPRNDGVIDVRGEWVGDGGPPPPTAIDRLMGR